jgi:two-component system phosphate regulon sensor histidine kinase PhoR
VEEVARHVESIGLRLEQVWREHREDDLNLNLLLANMVEGVMVVDRQRTVRLVNGALLRLFGLEQRPIGRTVLEALREARVELIIREAMSGGLPVRQEASLASLGMAVARHFAISAVPVRGKREEVEGAVVVFHDITGIKEAEIMRRDFIANVSHELRTPLAVFRGYLETLEEHPNLPEPERRRTLEAMRRNSDRLTGLVEDLLTLTRIESGQAGFELSPVRLGALCRRLLDDWHERAGATEARIICDVPDDLPPVEVDPLRFEQVLLNLLENAEAYSSEPREIGIEARRDGEELELRVRDNGIGIPAADLGRIFERFYRIDKARNRSSGGSGLGLSISREIILAHGGTIRAESELGRGTTIVIRLPLGKADGP